MLIVKRLEVIRMTRPWMRIDEEQLDGNYTCQAPVYWSAVEFDIELEPDAVCGTPDELILSFNNESWKLHNPIIMMPPVFTENKPRRYIAAYTAIQMLTE